MGRCRLHTVVDPPFSGDSYVLYNCDQYEVLPTQLLPDELAGMHHVSVQELVGCYVIKTKCTYLGTEKLWKNAPITVPVLQNPYCVKSTGQHQVCIAK